MAAEVVSATTGAMNPLLGKLAALMGDEYKKLTGVRKQASFLRDELSAMKALLDKLELTDDLDPQAKNWRDHVREMSYDMENCIDDFMRQFGGANNAKSGFVRKTAQRLKRLWKRHQIADQIEELKARALEATERRMRYKIDDCVSSSSVRVAVDPRLSAIYQEAAGLVGIDGPRKELVSWLTTTEEKLKVVSIVGFGGLGKTTLAKQVYDEIEKQFDCKAFVSVSQRPDMTSLLTGLQLKLGMKEKEGSSHAPEVRDIIDRLREHLAQKRYLIVVDDLWDESAWKIISCVFAEGGNGSTIIVTTRVDDVALRACCNDRKCIYRMRPLEEQDSRRLFFNRIFGSEDCCPSQFKKVLSEILKKCGGLPLAIITIASLLASRQARSMNEWESIRNSLGTKFAAKPTLEEMRSILNLSYIHLPLHLRACLLYLGMYPEDRMIWRDDLARQWIAEGFINHLHGTDLEDVVKNYFNELINRSLIQPEHTECGEVYSCRVHDMMLDLILTKCAEDNFLSVAYNCEDVARLHGYEYKVRRLSLQSSASGATSRTIATIQPHIRSFAWFGEFKHTPPLLMFKYLRVLAIEFSSNSLKAVDLTSIGELFQLRYLKIEVDCSILVLPVEDRTSIELPNQIQGLVYLETLDLTCQLVQNIPSDIVLLPRLSCLFLSCNRGLPEGIRNMKSLRTLSFDTDNSSLEDIRGIGELTNLRTLSINGTMVGAEVIDALVTSIGKLRNLKGLCLYFYFQPPEHDDGQLYSLSDPPLHIELLQLSWPFKGVPKWIGDLHYLRRLILCVQHLSTEDVHALGKLPSLIILNLKVLYILGDNPIIICTGFFPVLECLALLSVDDATACMAFEAGAMPKLQKLIINFDDKWGGTTPVGMEHLSGLQQIHLRLAHDDAESAFRNAVEVHPNHPSVIIE